MRKRLGRWLRRLAAAGLALGAAAYYLRFGPGVFTADRLAERAAILVSASDETHAAVLEVIYAHAGASASFASAAEGISLTPQEPGGADGALAGKAASAPPVSAETVWAVLRRAVVEQHVIERELVRLFAAPRAPDTALWGNLSRDAYIALVRGRQAFYAEAVQALRSGDSGQLVYLANAFQREDDARRARLGVPPAVWAAEPLR